MKDGSLLQTFLPQRPRRLLLIGCCCHAYSEGLRPSNSPTRSLASRFAGSLRSRGSLRCARLATFSLEGLRPSNSPTRSLASRFAGSLRSRGSLRCARLATCFGPSWALRFARSRPASAIVGGFGPRLATSSPVVKRERAVTGCQHARAHQRAQRFGRRIAPGMFNHEQRLLFNQRAGGLDRLQQLARAIRRIEKNDVERTATRRLRCAGKPSWDNSIAVADAASLEVAPDEGECARIVFDERHVRRAATQRFDPDRARSREPIQHPGPFDPARHHVEQRLAQLVGGWSQPLPCRSFDASPF